MIAPIPVPPDAPVELEGPVDDVEQEVVEIAAMAREMGRMSPTADNLLKAGYH